MAKQLVNRPAAGWILVALSLVFPACAFKGQTGPGPQAAGFANTWQIRPARMRIYPSTRIMRDGNERVLDAHIEFLDDAGDSIKASGKLHFELFAIGSAGEATGKQLYSWDVPLITLDQNRQYFEITHTYLFRLRLDSAALASQRLLLSVSCLLADGRQLQARATIGPDGVIAENTTAAAR